MMARFAALNDYIRTTQTGYSEFDTSRYPDFRNDPVWGSLGVLVEKLVTIQAATLAGQFQPSARFIFWCSSSTRPIFQ